MDDINVLKKKERKWKIFWHISILGLILLKILFLVLLILFDRFEKDLCIGFAGLILIYALYFLVTEEYRIDYLSWCLISWPVTVMRDLFESVTGFGLVYLLIALCLSILFLLLTWKFRKVSKLLYLVSCQKGEMRS